MKFKTYVRYALASFITCCFSFQSNAQTLSLSSANVQLNAAANSKTTFDIISDSYWGIYNVPSWMTLDTVWGDSNKTIHITASQNPYTIPRIDTLKLYWLNSNWEYYSGTTEIVTQAASSNGVSDSILQIGASNGSTTNFTITASMYWEITDLPSWLTVDKNWQQTGKTVTLTATENPQCTVRSGTFTVNRLLDDSTYLEATVTVNQTASTYGVSTENLIIADSSGSIAKFWVNTSGLWTVSGLSSWLSANKISSTGKDTITLTAQKNSMSYYRADTLTVSVKGGTTYTIVVIQNQASAVFSISPTTLVISDSLTNAITITVTSNTNWGLINMPSWLTTSNIIGYGDSTLTLTAQKNSTNASRTDSLVAYWFDGNNIYHQQKIAITQTVNGVVLVASFGDDQNMVVYPNPVKTAFSINFDLDKIKTVSINTIEGKLLKNISDNFESIDISFLPNACYFISILTKDNEIISKSILKQ